MPVEQRADQIMASMPMASDFAAPTAVPEPSDVPGLTRPLHRGHSRGFTIEVVVELGFASREAADRAIEDVPLERQIA